MYGFGVEEPCPPDRPVRTSEGCFPRPGGVEDQPPAKAGATFPSWLTPGLIIGGIVGFVVVAIAIEELAGDTQLKGEIE